MATPGETPPAVGSRSLSARERAGRFCQRFGLRVPILQAPMAGACPASLASEVANAGGMGGLGALTTSPDGIADWVREFHGCLYRVEERLGPGLGEEQRSHEADNEE
jgi:Nitronate monooxygenase